MIIYFDLHRKGIFATAFTKSGFPIKPHYKSRIATLSRLFYIQSFWPSLVFSDVRLEENDDKIIVFDSFSSPDYLEWLIKKHPGKRIIQWFWNPIRSLDKSAYPSEVELWTYSKSDSQKYGINYNTQFFFDSLAKLSSPISVESPVHKVIFYGRNKDRLDVLDKLSKELETSGADVSLVIQKTINTKHLRWLLEETQPYEDVIDLIRQYDIILDYSLSETAGLSLRFMESLFLNKKLITNNPAVLSEPFYDPSNIYVMGFDNRSYRDFFETPYRAVDDEIKDYYLLSNWYNRF